MEVITYPYWSLNQISNSGPTYPKQNKAQQNRAYVLLRPLQVYVQQWNYHWRSNSFEIHVNGCWCHGLLRHRTHETVLLNMLDKRVLVFDENICAIPVLKMINIFPKINPSCLKKTATTIIIPKPYRLTVPFVYNVSFVCIYVQLWTLMILVQIA